MSYIVDYHRWSALFEAAVPFDPSGSYSDPTLGLTTGEVNSRKVTIGGKDGNWGGAMPRALAFARVANDFMRERFGKNNSISSQKRSLRRTASGGISDHYQGNPEAYAVDIACNVTQGDQLFDYLMRWFGHPELKSGKWINVIKDGYRYQIGWRVPQHFNHIHIGVKRVGSKPDSVSTLGQATRDNRLLKIGDNNPNVVKALQLALGIPPTGEYDIFTSNEVKEFQRKNLNSTGSPLVVDGIVGPETSKAIEKNLGVNIWSDMQSSSRKVLPRVNLAGGTEIFSKSSVISAPASISGPIPVFVFYPGIKVGGKKGREYMPPLIKEAVPDWYSKYVIVVPDEHTTSWKNVMLDLEPVLKQMGGVPSSLNVGIFSGSGNDSADIQRSLPSIQLDNFIIIDPFVSSRLIKNVEDLANRGTKIYLMSNPNGWVRPRLDKLQTKVQELRGKTVDSNLGHMKIPAEALRVFKLDLEKSV